MTFLICGFGGRGRLAVALALTLGTQLNPISAAAQSPKANSVVESLFGTNVDTKGLVNRYAVAFLRGPGSYTLADGTVGEGDLQFKTRKGSVLYVNRKQEIPANQLKSFTIKGHTLVPQGKFNYSYGINSYPAENAFIEYTDTTGVLQLATYYTAEPTGDWTAYFALLLLRRRGSPTFAIGPDNDRKLTKLARQQLARFFEPWPALQDEWLRNKAPFDSLPELVRRANTIPANSLVPVH